MSKKILITYTTAGGGHVAITNALKQYLTSTSQLKIKTVDTSLTLTSPTYRIVGEYFSSFHQKNWQNNNTPQKSLLIHQLTAPLIVSRLVKAIKSFKPDLIIATNAFSTYEVASALKLAKATIPHIVAIADPFTIHHSWTTYKNADHYLAPTPEAKKILLSRKIPSKNISITGLPLRLGVFTPTLTQNRARNKLQLDKNKPTFFIGGSGEGHGQIFKLTKKLLTHPQTKSLCQLIVVAGKNKLLKTRLDALSKKCSNLRAFGHTNMIDQLLIASDIVVGKPGPNILFESLMLQKPFIATNPPLSQELGNYHYITQKKLGLVTRQLDQTLETLIDFINHPSKLKKFQPGIQKHRRRYLGTPQKTLKLINHFLVV